MSGITYVNQVGAIGGMNQAAPGTLIPDTFVRFAQDVLFDRAGFIRRRGPFKAFTMYTSANTTDTTAFVESGADYEYVLGVFSTFDPVGVPRVGMLINSVTGSTVKTIFRVFDKQLKFLGEELLFATAASSVGVSTAADSIENLSIVNGKQALGGGMWITFAANPSEPDKHYQFFWRGGYGIGAPAKGPITTTGTFSSFYTTGFASPHGTLDSTITSITTTNLSSGMFVYANNTFIGTIKSTTSTSVILDKFPFVWDSVVETNETDAGATHLGNITKTGVTLTFTSLRPYEQVHGRGTITIDSVTNNVVNSGTVGTSGEGHWSSAKVADWYLYRASDNAFLGKIKTVGASNTTVTLYATGSVGTGIMLTGEDYIMKPITPTVPSTVLVGSSGAAFSSIVSKRSADSFAGLYTAVYAGYQWYGNVANADKDVNRVVFSAYHDKEAVDLSANAADSIVFPGKSQFRGMAAAATGLLVFLEDRTYILRGNDRTNFSVEQLYPEGCLCASSIVEYGGGVFWAGKSGILYYDGASVRNMTKDNLGLYYTDALDTFNPELDRVIAFMHKNNLVVTFTSFKSPFQAIRYEPLYAADWAIQVLNGRTWEELDPTFTYDDLNTQNNTPLYWDQKILNDVAASGGTGLGMSWGTGGVISAKELTSNVAKLTISSGHGFKVGDSVTITNVDSTFNGTYVLTAVTDTSISYSKTASNVVVTSVNPYGIVTQAIYTITNKALTSNVATLTTSAAHGFAVGNLMHIYGVDSTFNGNYTITAVTTNTFSYALTSANVTSAAATGSVYKSTGFVWGNTSNIYKYAPLRKQTSMTFSIYLPTNALTTLSNMDFRGVTNVETTNGLKTLLGVNSVESAGMRARLVDIHPVYDINTNGEDAYLVEKINIPTSGLVLGPDFYLQTKHYTLGNPILRKWFQRVMLSMLLYDGCLRLDLVDADDNDAIDVTKKKHQYWELFTEEGYSWAYLTDVLFPKITSPDKATWTNVEATTDFWDDLFMTDFNRYKMKTAWRNPSVGFRLYQLNNYKKPYNGVVTTPNRIEMQSFTVGFKALREGRQ